MSDGSVAPGNATSLDVTLSNAPIGVAGFDVTLGVGNASVTTITDAATGDAFRLESMNVSDDGSSVVLSGVDLNDSITPGATDVTLGSIDIEGFAAGKPDITVENANIDSDEGGSVMPETNSGQLTVGSMAQLSVNVSFANQTTNGDSVTIELVTMSEGGFIAIHNANLTEGNALGSVVGVSEYLIPGLHENIEVELFNVPGQGFAENMNLEENQTLIAMPHLDTNDNEVYDFVNPGGQRRRSLHRGRLGRHRQCHSDGRGHHPQCDDRRPRTNPSHRDRYHDGDNSALDVPRELSGYDIIVGLDPKARPRSSGPRTPTASGSRACSTMGRIGVRSSCAQPTSTAASKPA